MYHNIIFLYLDILTKFLIYRPTRIAVALIIIPFMPSSNIFPIGFVVADRILYIPAIGYSLLLSIGFHNLYVRQKHAAKAILIFIGMLYICRSNQRIIDWQSDFSLFQSAIRVNPYNAKIYYNLGAICLQNNEYEQALIFIKKANELAPKQPSTLNNLANAYRHLSNHKKAIQYYLEALELT